MKTLNRIQSRIDVNKSGYGISEKLRVQLLWMAVDHPLNVHLNIGAGPAQRKERSNDEINTSDERTNTCRSLTSLSLVFSSAKLTVVSGLARRCLDSFEK